MFQIELHWWLSGKKSACSAGDLGPIPALGRSPRGGHGNPLQYSCLENPRKMDGEDWQAAVTQSDMTEVTKQQQQHILD